VIEGLPVLNEPLDSDELVQGNTFCELLLLVGHDFDPAMER
jgi:hypothetical protein